MNQYMRTLKYIRNEVVGHPSSKLFGYSKPAYCILDTDSVTKDSFKYNVHQLDNFTGKASDINLALNNFIKSGYTIVICISSKYKIDKFLN